MKVYFISEHFPVKEDSLPTGGVQIHIKHMTNQFSIRGADCIYKHKDEIEAVQFEENDICVFNDWSTWRRVACPSIMIFHGWEGGYPLSSFIVSERQRIAKEADATMHVGKYIEKHYGTKADATIQGATRMPASISHKPESGMFRVVWLGRLEPDTQPYLMMLAFGGLLGRLSKDERANVKLIILGDGSLRKHLENYATSNTIDGRPILSHVEFAGFRQNIWDYLQLADAVVATGFLSSLEAMGIGAPTFVCTDESTCELKRDYWKMMSYPPVVCNGYGMLTDNLAYEFEHRGIGADHLAQKAKDVKEFFSWNSILRTYDELFALARSRYQARQVK